MNRRTFIKLIAATMAAPYLPAAHYLPEDKVAGKIRAVTALEEFLEGVRLGIEIETDEDIAKMKGISYEDWIAIKEETEEREDKRCKQFMLSHGLRHLINTEKSSIL